MSELDVATDDTLGSSEDSRVQRTGTGPRVTLSRYHMGGLLGRGGMGDVVLGHDPEIGRDIAIKRMRSDYTGADGAARFVREAKIQARLDHPAIVPVHELGHDADGQPYFTIGNAVLVALLSRMFGPLIIAPGVVCIMALSLSSYPNLIDRGRYMIALLVVAWLGPIALEHYDVIGSTWEITDGAVVSRSSVVTIGGTATTALLVISNAITFVVTGLFANALARTRRDAQRRATAQTWHMQQFLPVERSPDSVD